MIEFCSRKRMAAAILLLFSITVVTVIVEGMWSAKHRLAEVNTEEKEASRCGSSAENIVQECQACTSLEIKAEQVYCEKTGYREEIQCKGGETFKRSCKVDPWIEEKKFWILQCLTCLLGVGSYGMVRLRQSKLDKLLMEKVSRQIAA